MQENNQTFNSYYLEMEELLNKLIKMGWKPFGKTGINERDCFVYMNNGHCIRLHKGVYADNMLCGQYDLRQIVSKESGLWQFVCKNEMVNLEYDITKSYKDSRDRVHHGGYNGDRYLEGFDMYNYKYRIIESALKDEDELEKFLLENIKIS